MTRAVAARLAPAGPALAVLALAGLALAGLVAAASLAACSAPRFSEPQAPVTVSGPLGPVPAPRGTPRAGVLTIAEPPGAAPRWILPIMTAAHDSVFTVASFDYQCWRPLLWMGDGVSPAWNPALSLAASFGWSSDRKTFSVSLKPGLIWSDGAPLTARDVLFTYHELKAAVAEAPANWVGYVPRLGLPDQVASVSVTGPRLIVFHLTQPVNPWWFTQDELAALAPMPAHAWAKAAADGPIVDFTKPANATAIYDYLAGASATPATYATDPLWQVVDGPYRLTGFDAVTGAFTMAANTSYAGPHAKLYPALSAVPFAADATELAALRAGTIDQGYLPLTGLSHLGELRSAGYQAFAYPDFGWNYIAYNFKDATGHFGELIRQPYLRQALAHLDDQPTYIGSVLHGIGTPGYGPVPGIPASPYVPASRTGTGYAFSVPGAVRLLRARGWTVQPGGTDTCSSPGTGAGHCGAGVPLGTPLAFPLAYATSPAVTGQLARAFAADAARAGISITLVPRPFSYLVASYNDATSPWNSGKWAAMYFGGFTSAAYPTGFGVFNSAGAANFGGYSDPAADALIQATVTGPDQMAAKQAASYLASSQPALFLPQPDQIVVWKKTVSGPRAAFEGLTQFRPNPELEYFTR